MSSPDGPKVLTFYTDCDWNGGDSDRTPITAAYHDINNAVEELAIMTTVQSISYSHIIFTNVIRLFATVLYRGPSPFDLFEGKNPYGKSPLNRGDTMLYVTT